MHENQRTPINADRQNQFEIKNPNNVMGRSSAGAVNEIIGITNNTRKVSYPVNSGNALISNTIIQGSQSLPINMRPIIVGVGQVVSEDAVGDGSGSIDTQTEKKSRHHELGMHMQDDMNVKTLTDGVYQDVNMVTMHSNPAFQEHFLSVGPGSQACQDP